eukprot:gene8014-biopygen19605
MAAPQAPPKEQMTTMQFFCPPFVLLWLGNKCRLVAAVPPKTEQLRRQSAFFFLQKNEISWGDMWVICGWRPCDTARAKSPSPCKSSPPAFFPLETREGGGGLQDRRYLTRGGKILDPHKSLASCGIDRGATLSINVRAHIDLHSWGTYRPLAETSREKKEVAGTRFGRQDPTNPEACFRERPVRDVPWHLVRRRQEDPGARVRSECARDARPWRVRDARPPQGCAVL